MKNQFLMSKDYFLSLLRMNYQFLTDLKTKSNDNKKLIQRGLKTTLVGIIASAMLAAIKIFTGIVGNSYALIADGIESLTDIFTSSIVLTGLYFAAKPADEDHPYGHGKAEPFAGSSCCFRNFYCSYDNNCTKCL